MAEQTARDIMMTAPVAVGPQTSVVEVACVMRDQDIGAVLVVQDEEVQALVTDRDLVVHVMCGGGNIGDRSVAEACSEELVSLSPDDAIGRAAQLMREHAVRRLPVIEEGRPVGVVSLGDLAVTQRADAALVGIGTSRPND